MAETYFSRKGKLNDVVLIRSLAIVMVVAYHAYEMMMVEGHLPKSHMMYREMYYDLQNIVLRFRMPLFILISGYLFSHLENDRGKYATFKGLFRNKFKRLIIPFFFFVTVFMISVGDFKWEPYYTWSYLHLWFIPMLFWCFLFTRIQSFLPFSGRKWWKVSLLSIFFLYSMYPLVTVPFFGLSSFGVWYFWFYFGYQLYLTRDSVYGVFEKQQWWYTFLLLSIFVICTWQKILQPHSPIWTPIYTKGANLSIVMIFWYWINNLLMKGRIGDRALSNFNWLNKHSYGIYVLHYWLQPFLISSTAVAMLGLDTLALEYPILFPLAFFLSSFVLSLGLTWLLLKTRFGRFLIG